MPILGRADTFTPIARVTFDDQSVPTLFAQLKADFEGQRNILIEVQPFWATAHGGSDATVNAYYSDNEVFLTTDYKHRTVSSLNVTRRVQVDDVTTVSSSTTVGTVRIAIEPESGDTDDFASYYWDGRDIKLYLGGPDFTRAEYGLIWSGKVEDAEWDDESGTLSLRLLDATLPLRDPLSDSTWSGTGGLNGGEDLREVVKPKAYGIVKNCAPTLIDAGNLVYQWHDLSSFSLDAVYDDGEKLVDAGSVVDVFAHTFTESTNVYVYDLANSVFRLREQPAGLVTCSVHGDNEAPDGYVQTAADVALRMIEQGPALADSELNRSSFSRLNGLSSAPVGYFQPSGSQTTTLEAVQSVLGAIWGFTTTDPEGRLSVARVGLDEGPPVAVIEEGFVVSMRRLKPPAPLHTFSLGYARSWTVQSEVKANATAAHKEFVSQAFRRPTADTDATVEAQRLNSKKREVDTLLANQSDAVAEQLRRFNLRKELRHIYEATVERQQFFISPGNIVRLKYTRFGLDTGRDFFVFSVREDTETNLTTLGLWG